MFHIIQKSIRPFKIYQLEKKQNKYKTISEYSVLLTLHGPNRAAEAVPQVDGCG